MDYSPKVRFFRIFTTLYTTRSFVLYDGCSDVNKKTKALNFCRKRGKFGGIFKLCDIIYYCAEYCGFVGFDGNGRLNLRGARTVNVLLFYDLYYCFGFIFFMDFIFWGKVCVWGRWWLIPLAAYDNLIDCETECIHPINDPCWVLTCKSMSIQLCFLS